MILEDAPEEYRSDVRLLSNTYNGYSRQLVLFLITYLATVTEIILLAGTIVIVNNGNILPDGQEE